jgi:hypothetical protein
MTALRAQVITDTLDQVKIVYLDRETSKWWNAKRSPDDTAVFCGWYWVKGKEEAGPFRTRSSAMRDAYYRYVLHREMPSIGRSALPEAKQDRVRQLARGRRIGKQTRAEYRAVA